LRAKSSPRSRPVRLPNDNRKSSSPTYEPPRLTANCPPPPTPKLWPTTSQRSSKARPNRPAAAPPTRPWPT